VFEGLTTDPVRPLPLALFKIPLNRIDEQCPPNGSSLSISEACTPSDPSLPKGEIRLEVRRCKASAVEKKDRIKRKLSQLVEWITRFNQDFPSHDEADSRTLTANIQCYGNVSLLHAAIELCDESLVERLVALGANPLGKSKVGTAISRALKLKDRAEEKWENKKQSESDQADTLAQQQVFDSFRRILEVMREKRVPPRVEQKYLFKEYGPEDTLPSSNETISGTRTGSRHNQRTEMEPQVPTRVERKRPWGSTQGGPTGATDIATDQHTRRSTWGNQSAKLPESGETPSSSWGSQSIQSTAPVAAQRPAWGTRVPKPTTQMGGSEGTMAKRPSWDSNQLDEAASADATPRNRWDRPSAPPPDSQAWGAKAAQDSASVPSRRPSYETPVGSDRWGPPNAFNGSMTRRSSSNGTQGGGNYSSAKRPSWDGVPNAAHASVLPYLKQDWLEAGHLRRCKKGDAPGACWHATKGSCHFWHTEPMIRGPLTYGSVNRNQLAVKYVTIKERDGWFTAAFTDIKFNKIVYAQGGNDFRVSDSGVHWYPTESAAIVALEFVVAFVRARYR
jgi:hypothetical protein